MDGYYCMFAAVVVAEIESNNNRETREKGKLRWKELADSEGFGLRRFIENETDN